MLLDEAGGSVLTTDGIGTPLAAVDNSVVLTCSVVEVVMLVGIVVVAVVIEAVAGIATLGTVPTAAAVVVAGTAKHPRAANWQHHFCLSGDQAACQFENSASQSKNVSENGMVVSLQLASSSLHSLQTGHCSNTILWASVHAPGTFTNRPLLVAHRIRALQVAD